MGGRGESGDQWRDDFRDDYDVARGGQGRNLLRKIEGEPGKQVYVGKRKQDHGRFGAKVGQESEEKRARYAEGGGGSGDWSGYTGGFDGFGNGLPMAFGPVPTFGYPFGYAPD